MTGAYPLDVDADGITDLVVLRVGESRLCRGLGDCRFEHANETWASTPTPAWTTAFSATWEGDAALPTLAFGNYVDPDDKRRRRRPGAPTTSCSGRRRRGPGTATRSPLSPGYCTLSMLFSDWDGSGRRDLRVSNDRHYYRRRARSSSGASRPARRRGSTRPADGWASTADLGHGDRDATT